MSKRSRRRSDRLWCRRSVKAEALDAVERVEMARQVAAKAKAKEPAAALVLSMLPWGTQGQWLMGRTARDVLIKRPSSSAGSHSAHLYKLKGARALAFTGLEKAPWRLQDTVHCCC
jgi:hypothetical protein